MTTAADIAQAILNGGADDDLNQVVRALNERRRMLGRIARASIRVNNYVRFTDQAKNYAGREGIVEKVNAKTVDVRVGDTLVRAPAELLEVI